jgi:hypothetical protein
VSQYPYAVSLSYPRIRQGVDKAVDPSIHIRESVALGPELEGDLVGACLSIGVDHFAQGAHISS